MGLEEHQRRHLLTWYVSVIELLDEIGEIARLGRPGAAPGGVLAPLREEGWLQLAGPLDRIREQARDLMAREAPEELRTLEATQPMAATMRWLSLLLCRLEEEMGDVEPGRLQRRYGRIPDGAARDLEAAQTEMGRELAQAREELSRLRGER